MPPAKRPELSVHKLEGGLNFSRKRIFAFLHCFELFCIAFFQKKRIFPALPLQRWGNFLFLKAKHNLVLQQGLGGLESPLQLHAQHFPDSTPLLFHFRSC